eukprot:gene26413-35061_t
MAVIVVYLSLFLVRNMNGYEFVDCDQMHDFLSMIGVVTFASYTFAFYVETNQITSSTAVYEQTSSSLVAFI